MTETVAVLGGGVAGLTAAHELAERGFAVTVYETRDRLGGKARSLPVPGSGTDGRGDLPAEHGFRFFPGFYRHVPDTMRRIGVERPPRGRRAGAARPGRGPQRAARRPRTCRSRSRTSRSSPASCSSSRPASASRRTRRRAFVERLLTLLTSCDERRLGQWELQSWWSFVGAEQRSPAFRKFLADGLTRTLVAARAREMSARTGGSILLQLLFDLTRAGGRADRVLDGPTSRRLDRPLGRAHRGRSAPRSAAARRSRGSRWRAGASAARPSRGETVTADHYVAAVPVEIMRTLAGARRCAPPSRG